MKCFIIQKFATLFFITVSLSCLFALSGCDEIKELIAKIPQLLPDAGSQYNATEEMRRAQDNRTNSNREEEVNNNSKNSLRGNINPMIQKDTNGIAILTYNDYESAFANPTVYNERFAYWCAKAAKDAYSESDSNATMSLLGFKNKKLDLLELSIPIYYKLGGIINKINFTVGLKAFIGYKELEKPINGTKSVVMISIRGSKTESNWLSNFNCGPVNWETGWTTIHEELLKSILTIIPMDTDLSSAPEVHGGFFLCTNKIWNKIIEDKDYKKYIDKSTLFIVTGHSLGGAIAELLCLKLRDYHHSPQYIINYGFASPPVGDKDLWQYANERKLNSRIFKIMNKNDIIPSAGIFAYTLASTKNVRDIIFPEKWAIDIGGNHSMDRYLEYTFDSLK